MSSAPLTLGQERQSVLDGLALPLLFLGSARIELIPSPDGGRVLAADVLARSPLTVAGSAALLCTAFHDTRVSSVSIVRDGDSVVAQCTYVLPFATWRIDLRTHPAVPPRIDLSSRHGAALPSLDPDRTSMTPLGPARAVPVPTPAAAIADPEAAER